MDQGSLVLQEQGDSSDPLPNHLAVVKVGHCARDLAGIRSIKSSSTRTPAP